MTIVYIIGSLAFGLFYIGCIVAYGESQLSRWPRANAKTTNSSPGTGPAGTSRQEADR